MIVCALLISLTGCAADKIASTPTQNVDVTMDTETAIESEGETEAVTLAAETAEKIFLPSPLQRRHRRQARQRNLSSQENRKLRNRQNRPGNPSRQRLRSKNLRASPLSRNSLRKRSQNRRSLRNRQRKRNSPSLLSLQLQQSLHRPNRLLQRSLPHRLSLLRRWKQSLPQKRSQRPHTIMNSTSMRSEPTASPSVRAWAIR